MNLTRTTATGLRAVVSCITGVQMLAGCAAMHMGRPEPLATPRIAPVAPAKATAEQEKLLDAQPANLSRLNVVRTWAVNPRLAEAWQPFALYVMRNSTLPPRDREILILRIGWLNQSQYEFTHHVLVAKRLGMSDAEIEYVKAGPDAAGWTASDAALVKAADQLHANAFIDDRVWAVLRSRYDDQQLMDLIVTVGQYNLISWYLNTLGTPLEDDVTGHPMRK